MAICPHCLTRFPDTEATCAHDGTALAPDAAYAYVDRELAPGDTVGEYRIEGKLGEGGFGAVFAAVHPVIGKRAAVKVLSRSLSANPQMVSRFISEARAVNQIRHRNIIDIFSFGQLPDGRQYYVMELLDGSTFDAYLRREGKLAPAQALPILRGIARALDAAHAKGILHRDLKPENVFLVFDEDGRIEPKLLDFGLVKLLGTPSGQHKTKTGTPMGTPFYMSPEQCRGKDVDARTDVYSFGVLAYQTLTGKLPFDGDGALEILLKHMEEPPPAATTFAPELPAAADVALGRMLSKAPEDRPATAGRALEELAAAVNGGPDAGVISGPSASAPTVGGVAARDAISSARTIAVPSGGQTFLGAESDVHALPVRRGSVGTWVLAAIAVLVLVLVGGGVVAFVRSGTPAAPPAVLTASASPSVSATAVAATATPSAAPPAPPATIALRVDGAPTGATVSLDGKVLGPAPGPFELPSGPPVKLVVAAKGFKAREVDVTRSADVVVSVALEKDKPAAKPGRTISKDLEDF